MLNLKTFVLLGCMIIHTHPTYPMNFLYELLNTTNNSLISDEEETIVNDFIIQYLQIHGINQETEQHVLHIMSRILKKNTTEIRAHFEHYLCAYLSIVLEKTKKEINNA